MASLASNFFYTLHINILFFIMEHLDHDKLYTDMQYRYKYVAKFIGFTEKDQEMLHKSASVVAGLVPTLVDAVYDRLFQFDATWEHFAYDQEGIKVKDSSKRGDVNQVTMDSEVIKFRKTMLTKYLKKLVTSEWNVSYLKYLDWVGHIHTTTPLKKSTINVEYIHCNALFGYLSSVVIESLSKCTEWDDDTRVAIASAYNKFFWIQNDFFAKYYVKDRVLTEKEQKAVQDEERAKEDGIRRELRGESLLNAAVGLGAGMVLGAFAFKHLK